MLIMAKSIVLGMMFWLMLHAADVSGEFQTVDAHKTNHVQADLTLVWAKYKAFELKPAVYEAADAESKLSAKDQEKLRAAVDESLKSAFPETANSGGRVLEIRPVIIDAQRVNPVVNRTIYWTAHGPLTCGGAAVRYDLFDREMGTKVGEVMSDRCAGRPWNSSPLGVFQAFRPADHSVTILKHNAKMLRRDIEEMARMRAAE